MRAKREYRNREDVEVAVLDALVDRSEDGMTVLELRAFVDADIDKLEAALSELKRDDLISISETDGSMVIKPDERVVPDPGEPESQPSLFDELRKRLPF